MSRKIVFLALLGLLLVAGVVSSEKHEFQAEVNRMMEILIHALYSKREVFLRELVSNAADANDKYRYTTLQAGRQPGELSIRIKADRDAKTLTIADDGIGMSKEELIANLGTIAQSGTKKFLEKLEDNKKDVNLIGQFGVGFYSAFVVADTITVTTRQEGNDQYIWESTAGASFTVDADPNGNTIEHGTEIKLSLKEDAAEYMDGNKIKELVHRYSEFIDYPIKLWEGHEIEVPVEESEVEVEIEQDTETAEEAEVEADQQEGEEDKPETPKTKKETVYDWELINKHKPLWARAKDEVTTEEYKAFYNALSKDGDEPLVWDHFKTEGGQEFTAIIYIPKIAPSAMYEQMGKTTSIKLYVKRVLISDSFDDLLPRYLNFIFGVVDSDDLPINVSREMLQEDKSLSAIKKKLVRKSLELVKKLADQEDPTDYNIFWNNYGKNIKLGLIEDTNNKPRLQKLLRFYSSKSNGTLTSLDDYITRMKENQKGIYYVAGESEEQVKKSPFLENLIARDFEVLYLVDPIDEYAIQHLPEYESHKIISASKEGLKFGDEAEDEKEKEKELTEQYTPVIDFLKEKLAGKVEKVVLSNRLANSPCVLVTGLYGWSANMERIVKAQALGDQSRQSYMASRKTLEINPNHPIIIDLNNRVQAEDTSAEETVHLLYDTALLTSGFSLDDTAGFASRMYKLLGANLPEASSASNTATPSEEHNHNHNDEI
jgi:HSP90 family molecular chaperone